MGAKENLKIPEALLAAAQRRDAAAYGALFAEDATVRVAGVPRDLGGVAQGRQQIVANQEEFWRRVDTPGDVRLVNVFADDQHVCWEERVSGKFNGTRFFRGNGQPFTTYECFVATVQDGRIRGLRNYTNFLDVYVQAGLVPVESLTTGS